MAGPRKKKGFNTPFADRAGELRDTMRRAAAEKAERHRTEEARARREAEAADAVRAGAESNVDADAAASDADLFRAWVGEVQPVSTRAGPARRQGPPPPREAPALREDEDAEALAVLSEMVAERGPLDVADTDEYLEGLAHGVDRRLLRRLKAGDFAVQAHLDLHGMIQETAGREVRRFIEDARARGLRCVLLIHGRGLRSRNREPVLKHALTRWLSRGNLGRQILAFSTARREDGGGGAMYVLLRR